MSTVSICWSVLSSGKSLCNQRLTVRAFETDNDALEIFYQLESNCSIYNILEKLDYDSWRTGVAVHYEFSSSHASL